MIDKQDLQAFIDTAIEGLGDYEVKEHYDDENLTLYSVHGVKYDLSDIIKQLLEFTVKKIPRDLLQLLLALVYERTEISSTPKNRTWIEHNLDSIIKTHYSDNSEEIIETLRDFL